MTEVAATKTPATISDLVTAMIAAWRAELGTVPTADALGVLLAQVCLETANGTSLIQYNLGNWKRPNPTPEALWCQFSTFEYVNGARVDIHPPDPGCRFAAFATLADGCQAFLRSYCSGHWSIAWSAILAGDVDGFAAAIRSLGYYTAPEAQYAQGMRARLQLIQPTIAKMLQADATAPYDTIPAMPDVTPDEPNTSDDPES